MTTTESYPSIASIEQRLDAVRGRHLLVQLAHAGAGLSAIVLGSLAVLGLMGFWPGQPPAALRWSLSIGTLCLWLAAGGWFVLLPIRRRLNRFQAARLVEEAHGGLFNSLINAVQLAGDRQAAPVLIEAAIVEANLRTRELPLGRAVATRAMLRWSIAASAAALAVALMAVLMPQQFSRGLQAALAPTAYVHGISDIKLLSVEPGDSACFVGETLTVTAKVDNPQHRPFQARLEIDGSAAPRVMLANDSRDSFSCLVGRLEKTTRYAVWIDNTRFPLDKPWYTVTVQQQVDIEGLDLLITPPSYLGSPPKSIAAAAGPFEAPLCSEVRFTVHLNSQEPGQDAHATGPLPAVRIETRSGQRLALQSDGGTSFSATMKITADDGYRIVLTDPAGRRLRQRPDARQADQEGVKEGFYLIKATPDAPPEIKFTEPGRDASTAPGGKLPAHLRASDDHALESVRIYIGPEGQEPRLLREFPAVRGKDRADLDCPIDIGPQYREGETLVYYAAATDNRDLGPLGGRQTTETPRYKILIQDPAKLAAERAKKFDELRRRLLALLELQQTQRVSTSIAAAKDPDIKALKATAGKIAAGQQQIRADMLDLVEHFAFDSDMDSVKQALAVLAANEAALAVTQARSLEGLADFAGRADAAKPLAASQDAIIRALQTLLAMLPAMQNPQAVKPTPGTDLPADAKEKLQDLKANLEKFQDEQKKLIQAAERLTKRPVDVFNKEDEKLLQDLIAAQDKWEKFLNEAFTDFSKLGQQDFSNPTMLQELISVKTDVTMAKDALKQKATEIATALEDNGIENAKSLTTNIEKWLPDTPDRQKWEMEDPKEQTSTEQPEMPKELEDLVGDLLEQEEDLFEDMDDLTGKYSQSGDKGIGWDAMDGPISNMNAQGVTGNQLPNSSEISGRSGEGRQGKASGEFVEDKAVGKGGRRTPTRLTPEPFQQGQINDKSEESPGGSTGGGKLSGAGSEGLEGPVPPPLAQELKRLAGKHAQLLNKAERTQAGMKVSDYSNYKFLETITLMNRVQSDLDAGKYTNALRQQQTLVSALKETRLLLGGKIDVSVDPGSAMPKYIKDDIADAKNGKLPREFSDALKNYFTRLGEGAAPTSQPGK